MSIVGDWALSITIFKGDCRDVLRDLPAESVHCVVTSPPYWGLRDYGVAGQIGLESSYADFVDAMRKVFCEVRRVLRKDGTVWLNLGDSYASAWVCNRRSEIGLGSMVNGSRPNRTDRLGSGLKEKDLCGIPWRVAFALQADGWYLRQDIIWSKPNPMPESVHDRCTKAHEYIFLLSKNERYYYDAEAIKDDANSFGRQHTSGTQSPKTVALKAAGLHGVGGDLGLNYEREQRNKRSVWEVATQPFSEAHFATFPPALIEPCILAGCPEKCCAKCGAPWVREIERILAEVKSPRSEYGNGAGRNDGNRSQLVGACSKTLGFSPSCSCGTHRIGLGEDRWTTECIIPGTVLDPFGGAGTTGLVADRLGRNAILIELNPEYAAMAERRIKGDAGMFAEVTSLGVDKGKLTVV